MIQPLTFDEYITLAKNASRVAVFREIPQGALTVIEAYRLLHQHYGTEGVIFENLQQKELLRYSYLGFESQAVLTLSHHQENQPLDALRKLQKKLTYATREAVAPLITHAMGFMTYDIVRCFENIPDRHPSDPTLPMLSFRFYTLSVTFNHDRQSILMSTLTEVGDNAEKSYQQAQQKISDVITLFSTKIPPFEGAPISHSNATIQVDVSDADFMKKIEKAKEYIVKGDAFQIVLSRCFRRNYTISPLEIYHSLCQVSPSPFMFYFPLVAGAMIGASPERMISVQDKHVTVNPIAGTRKHRGQQHEQEISVDLLQDKKELAEHIMLVDLGRNDVGAVCEPGSVKVSELMQVKHYSHVSHITSTVQGKLQQKYDAFDAFAAAFPAGTLSGAPKIRAMEIIDELETSRRGMYGGAICRIDAAGNFDSCIAIRMAILNKGVATIRVGAGIVYDSNPLAEAEETRQKSQSILHAIAAAHGESHVINYR